MDEKQLATKADLGALKTEILEALRETETKLLSAFFQYQEHSSFRFQKITADVASSSKSAS